MRSIALACLLLTACVASEASPRAMRTGTVPPPPAGALGLAWSVAGTQTGARFGTAVASAGDVNGDGYDDVVVGEEQYDHTAPNEGRASLFLGSPRGLTEATAWSAEGDERGAILGVAVASAGDVNGDGYDDVVIGASMAASGDVDYAGEAFLFLGSFDGLSSEPAWQIKGTQTFEYLGESVASAGDVNADGFDDVIVGAPMYTGTREYQGGAWVYLGSASGLSDQPAWTGLGVQIDNRYGASVAGAGDVNHDGFDDIIVGSPESNLDDDGLGKAHAYYGSAIGLSSKPSWVADTPTGALAFGSSVAGAGDVDGDGFDDVVVGDAGGVYVSSDRGVVSVFLGSPSGLSTTSAIDVRSPEANAEFGSSVAGAGDVNADGYADVLVGAPRFDGLHRDEGRAYLFLGSPLGMSPLPDWVDVSDMEGAQLGESVASAGDVNGDGVSDVIVGSPAYAVIEDSEGKASLFEGIRAAAPPAEDTGSGDTSLVDADPDTDIATVDSDSAFPTDILPEPTCGCAFDGASHTGIAVAVLGAWSQRRRRASAPHGA